MASGRFVTRSSPSSPAAPGASTDPGLLVRASKPGLGKSFLLALEAGKADQYTPAPGWTIEIISTDRMWTPGGCASAPSVIVANRWEVYLDINASNTKGGPHSTQLVAFDLKNKTFETFLPTPNDVTYLGQTPVAVGDHSVALLIDAAGPPPPYTTEKLIREMKLRVRTVDFTTGTWVDRTVTAVPQYPLYLGASQSGYWSFGTDGYDGYVRVSPTGTGEFLTERNDAFGPTVDGVKPSARKPVAGGKDLVYTEAVSGATKAEIHDWRSPWAVGWSGQHGYFTARPTVDDVAAVPGVYDTKAFSWDWVFASTPAVNADSLASTVFVVGTLTI